VARELLDLTELCERTGVTPRTVRYYIQQGLLPSPGQSGPGAKYDQGHLSRLFLIRRLQQDHLPLAEIRKRLVHLDDASVESLVEHPTRNSPAADYVEEVLGRRAIAEPAPVVAEKRAPSSSSPQGQRSTWERIVISADVELHVRRPLSREDNRRVEKLLEQAFRILTRDP
jgi:DNA-binding transcriptional MerR regulator